LVGIELYGEEFWPIEESLAELKQLADTAGAQVVGTLSQAREKPDQKYFIGKGKIDELSALVNQKDANLVVFDSELSASQERNLEEALGIKIIDRTELILDIFAQHAHSREGKLQVELAQSEFRLTRLTGHGVLMSRLGGGIGTKGPGETKLEMDRRRIRERVSLIKKELEDVRRGRHLRREKRRASLIPVAAIVGYTNAGKSTLLNALTSANVLVEDKLFATLDPTTRRVALPEGGEILLTDTVGFIQKLPHQLVDAFRATLEEVTEADILIHVVDSNHPYLEDQITAVYNVLEELEIITKTIITVFNKMDKKSVSKNIFEKYAPSVSISALTGKGLDDLLKAIQEQLKHNLVRVKLKIPLKRMDFVSLLHQRGRVISEEYTQDSVIMEAEIDRLFAERLAGFTLPAGRQGVPGPPP
jgi:GTP-binding protein HflX